ncbi:MAG TPA: hypothetical protein VH092_07175 [Urbifossiella sp.]|jgi:hypothetical protein|nr:hypothetical protein [Urbifossiella sp.]
MGLSILLAAALAPTAPEPAVPAADAPRLKLALTGADAFRNGRDTLFDLRIELDNRTGRALTARSHFASAFDALTLVVRDANGKELRRQPVAAHLSPSTLTPRPFTLAAGKTRQALRVPVELPADTRTVRVSLYGTFPGSGIDDLLLTDVLPVTVRPAP